MKIFNLQMWRKHEFWANITLYHDSLIFMSVKKWCKLKKIYKQYEKLYQIIPRRRTPKNFFRKKIKTPNFSSLQLQHSLLHLVLDSGHLRFFRSSLKLCQWILTQSRDDSSRVRILTNQNDGSVEDSVLLVLPYMSTLNSFLFLNIPSIISISFLA